MKIPLKVRKSIETGKPFSLATATKKGKPNINYIGYLKLIDSGTVLIADNYFKKTKKNILENNQVAFGVLDEKAKSYQLKGRVKYYTKGKYYDEVRRWCDKKYPRKGAVVIHITEVYNGGKRIA